MSIRILTKDHERTIDINGKVIRRFLRDSETDFKNMERIDKYLDDIALLVISGIANIGDVIKNNDTIRSIRYANYSCYSKVFYNSEIVIEESFTYIKHGQEKRKKEYYKVIKMSKYFKKHLKKNYRKTYYKLYKRALRKNKKYLKEE